MQTLTRAQFTTYFCSTEQVLTAYTPGHMPNHKVCGRIGTRDKLDWSKWIKFYRMAQLCDGPLEHYLEFKENYKKEFRLSYILNWTSENVYGLFRKYWAYQNAKNETILYSQDCRLYKTGPVRLRIAVNMLNNCMCLTKEERIELGQLITDRYHELMKHIHLFMIEYYSYDDNLPF